MYKLTGRRIGPGIELRFYQDHRCVATALVPLSQFVGFASRQSFQVDFEVVPDPLPTELRTEEIGKLSPQERATWRGEGGGS